MRSIERKTLWLHKFYYEEGWLFWKNPESNRIKPGMLAGGMLNNGYIRVDTEGRSFAAHVIIYEMHFGDVPDGLEIDHKDQNRSNNLLDNLREGTHQQNSFNVDKHKDNTSGFKGVSKKRNKWRARIMIAGVEYALGVYPSPEEASTAYLEAAARLHGEFFRA